MGAKCGLTPNEVLDLEYWQFCACVEGYEQRLQDLLPLTVLTGYYTGYYTNTKRPKKPQAIIAKMSSSQEKTIKAPAKITKDDIAIFAERERRRLQSTQNMKLRGERCAQRRD